MPVITITGLIGTGSPEVGADVARKLGIDFVDRLILAEAAKKLGTTVAAVAERTERAPSLGDRFAGFVRAVLERSALAGGGADPYFGGGLDALLVREYKDFPVEGAIPADGTVDDDLIRVTAAAIREIAESGNVIIAGRGANMILANEPGILHVGLTSRKTQRIERIMERVSLDRAEAEKYTTENDKARNAYFQRYFKVQPEDLRHYHMILNTDWMDVGQVADMVTAATSIIAKPPTK
jgi:cytidylate kinase